VRIQLQNRGTDLQLMRPAAEFSGEREAFGRRPSGGHGLQFRFQFHPAFWFSFHGSKIGARVGHLWSKARNKSGIFPGLGQGKSNYQNEPIDLQLFHGNNPESNTINLVGLRPELPFPAGPKAASNHHGWFRFPSGANLDRFNKPARSPAPAADRAFQFYGRSGQPRLRNDAPDPGGSSHSRIGARPN